MPNENYRLSGWNLEMVRQEMNTSTKIVLIAGIIYFMVFLFVPLCPFVSAALGNLSARIIPLFTGRQAYKAGAASMQELAQASADAEVKKWDRLFDKVLKGDDTIDTGTASWTGSQAKAAGESSMLQAGASAGTQGRLLAVFPLGLEFDPAGKECGIIFGADYERVSMKMTAFISVMGNKPVLTGIRSEPVYGKIGDLVKVQFLGMPAWHYACLFLSLILIYFTFSTLMLCTESGVKLKIFWLIFIAFGVFSLATVWDRAAPEVLFSFKRVIFSSASWVKYPLYSPAVLTISLPFGAIVFRVFYMLKSRKNKSIQ
jgi:hypothetical protein